MLEKIKHFLKEGFHYIFAVVLSLVIFSFPKFSIDILLFAITSIIIIGLYYISVKTNYKTVLRILSLYIFLNFIFFPFIYLIILKVDATSFKFDSNIFTSEKSSSLKTIKDYYEPEKLDKNVSAIWRIVKDTSKILDTSIGYLNDGNIIKLSQFLISKNCIPVPFDRPMYKATMNICDTNGIQIAFFIDKQEGCSLGIRGQLVREYLKTYLDDMASQLEHFEAEKTKIINRNDIWTYKQILPYSINIFSTDNMIPKSRLANVIFHLHQFFVATILISLLTGFFQAFIAKKRK